MDTISSDNFGPQAVNVDPQTAINNAKENLNFLAALCLQEQMIFLYPEMFLVLWQLLRSKIDLLRDFSQLAIGIPRGFAKTTLIKIWIVFCVLFTTKKFICVVSHIEDHAVNLLKDVFVMLSSQNICALFGSWNLNLERDRQECKIFNFRGRRIIIAGIGSSGNIRGLNVGNDRPDVMIFEDFQKKEDSKNEELSKALYDEMNGTFMKSKSPFGCLFIFVANMYPTVGSILKKLKVNPDWTSFIVGGILIDKDGVASSLWEELQPLTQLLSEYQRDLRAGCPEVFLSEVLNDENAGLKAGIDITKLPAFPYPEYELPQGRGIVIDPALDNPKSDYNGIGLVGLYDGVPTLEIVKLKRYSPLELIKQALILGFQTSTRLITVENVALQSTYLFWFQKICEDNGISGFHFMPLNIGGGTKNARIKAGLEKHSKGELHVKDQVKPFLNNELIAWDPGKKNNRDTCLDLLWMADKIYEQHGPLMLMPYEAEAQVNGKPEVLEEIENCEF